MLRSTATRTGTHAVLALLAVACAEPGPTAGPYEMAANAAAVTCGFRANNSLDKLLPCVTLEGVRAHQAALQAIADANGGSRTTGLPGHDASVAYVASQLTAAGYDVRLEPFSFSIFSLLSSALERTSPTSIAYGEGVDYVVMSYSGNGDVTAAVSEPGDVDRLGCNAGDWAGFPAGDIALVKRGACTFAVKATNAHNAGSVGVVIYNDGAPGRTGPIEGSLGFDFQLNIPVVGASYDLGVAWSSEPTVVRLAVNAIRGFASTQNLIAETRTGDPNNVVVAGAHLNAVGPGINNNGSGVAALLETAIQMRRVVARNRVRFAFWSGSENGGLGVLHHLNSLSEEQRSAIALYLDFDAIGSPNYVRFVVDGDGSSTPFAGPPGSAEIEAILGGLYTARGLPYEAARVSSADRAVFVSVNIPVGGIEAGDESIKTPAQAAVYGGTAGIQYDPCYHLACDTFANVNLEVLDLNADIVASAVLTFAMSTEVVNGIRGKGNFKGGKAAAPDPAAATF